MNIHNKSLNIIFKEFYDSNINYVVIRGFLKLPLTADTDLDIIINNNDFNKAICILNKYCYKRTECDIELNINNKLLRYYSFRTQGEYNNNMSNGCMQLDIYNYCFNYEGKEIFIAPDLFQINLFLNKIQKDAYYIPTNEYEIILLCMRSIYDQNYNWQQKHINRIKNIYNNKEKLLETINLYENFNNILIHLKKILNI
jgi:hypothetical protein